MSIIFYEKEYVEQILEDGVDKLTQRDLNYLAKYWSYAGLSEKEIHNNIENFCIANDRNFNLIQSYSFVHRAVIHSTHYKLRIDLIPVEITALELETIQNLNDYHIEKFLFTMLAVAKFFKNNQSRINVVESKYDDTLYSNTPIKEIQKLANISFSNSRWLDIKRKLTSNGIISPTIIDDEKWAIGNFCQMPSETIILIDDFRNISVYYDEYIGKPIIKCLGCDVKITRNSNRHKYCKGCWDKKNRELTRERVAKYRQQLKNVTL
jgi:hypothetical protein